MAMYAISDFHLAFTTDKPMDVFGDRWYKHEEKIKENWNNNITEEDTVLIAGDISWSMKMEDGMTDLNWIHNLPGRKVMIRGNHDYWWSSITKLNKLYDDMNFIQNNYFTYNDYAICGTRGWICPGGDKFTAHDNKIYEREIIRLKLSLDSALKGGYKKIIVMLHYPPFGSGKDKTSGFTKLIDEYKVQRVIYGHIHGQDEEVPNVTYINGIEYRLTSCDCIEFKPIKIL